jgi:hypothetical protein
VTREFQQKRITDTLIVFALLTGIVCFGFIFPDSTSDHNKIVHFSAHFGMSFLISSVVYAFCNIKLGIDNRKSFVLFTVITLIIGSLYKYWEIFNQPSPDPDFAKILVITGFYTSMSQNIAGIMAAMLIIKYFFSKNAVILPLPKRNLVLLNDFNSSSAKDMA